MDRDQEPVTAPPGGYSAASIENTAAEFTGATVGRVVGTLDGATVGDLLVTGALLGIFVPGARVGAAEVGIPVGALVGRRDGAEVGNIIGVAVGDDVGVDVGATARLTGTV